MKIELPNTFKCDDCGENFHSEDIDVILGTEHICSPCNLKAERFATLWLRIQQACRKWCERVPYAHMVKDLKEDESHCKILGGGK